MLRKTPFRTCLRYQYCRILAWSFPFYIHNWFSSNLKTKLIITPYFLESKKNLWKIENIFWDLNTFTFFLFFFSPIVKTDPKLPSRPTTKSGNRKGNPKIQNQNNSKLPTVSILNSKIDGIDGKQECLEKFLLEHVCGINCFVHPIFSSFGFWYFGHFSCVIFFPVFFCLAKCKQRLRNIFVFL